MVRMPDPRLVAMKVEAENRGYWRGLTHQAAIAAMQGMVSDSKIFIELANTKGLRVEEATAEASFRIDHALVHKLKEEEK